MIDYIPRPGSKTEAAVNYLRAHGGAATAVALSDAIDTARKNLPAQLKAATERGERSESAATQGSAAGGSEKE